MQTNNSEATYSSEIEEAIIGILLLQEDITDVIDRLTEKDFYLYNNKMVFRSMVELFSEGSKINTNTVYEKVRYLNSISVSWLMALVSNIVTVSSLDEYVEILKSYTKKREILAIAENVIDSICNKHEDVNDVIEATSKEIYTISVDKTGENDIISPRDLAMSSSDCINEILSSPKVPFDIDTGFRDINYFAGGLRRKEYYVIGARPSMGKSSLALNMAINIALKNESKLGVLYMSMEMGMKSVLMRTMSYLTHIPHTRIKSHMVTAKERDLLLGTSEQIFKSKFYLYDGNLPTVHDIRQAIIRTKMKDPSLSVVVIDHLGLCRLNNNGNRNQQITEFSMMIKPMAREFDVNILLVCQLNRGNMMRDDTRPVMSDLRDSGAIEQDADVILLLHRNSYQKQEEIARRTEIEPASLFIAKNRDGVTGAIELMWDSRFVSFYNKDLEGGINIEELQSVSV